MVSFRRQREGQRHMQEKPISAYLSTSSSIKSHCFVGLCLRGSKTDTTSLAVLEYYPKEKKIFLRHIYSSLQSTQKISGDKLIYDLLKDSFRRIDSIFFNSPLSLPQCMTCTLACPGHEECKESHILWQWKFFHRHKKKRSKVFSPYTDRCVESYLSKQLPEPFEIPHALNSNKAPLTARSLFLSRRLKEAYKSLKLYEFSAKVSLWFIGRALKVPKFKLRDYKSSLEGQKIRALVLKKMADKGLVFLYDQDRRLMEKNSHSFEAFLGSFTGVLNFVGECEKKPKNFPQKEAWIEFPNTKINWNFLLNEKNDSL